MKWAGILLVFRFLSVLLHDILTNLRGAQDVHVDLQIVHTGICIIFKYDCLTHRTSRQCYCAPMSMSMRIYLKQMFTFEDFWHYFPNGFCSVPKEIQGRKSSISLPPYHFVIIEFEGKVNYRSDWLVFWGIHFESRTVGAQCVCVPIWCLLDSNFEIGFNSLQSRDVSLPQRIKTISGLTQSPIQWALGSLSGSKLAGTWRWSLTVI
jgi:hypothetical protein